MGFSLRDKIRILEDAVKASQEQPSKNIQSDPNPLRSNIDQFWMNTNDMETDLYNFLMRIQNKDPELARYMRNKIRNVLSKFTYRPEASKKSNLPN